MSVKLGPITINYSLSTRPTVDIGVYEIVTNMGLVGPGSTGKRFDKVLGTVTLPGDPSGHPAILAGKLNECRQRLNNASALA